jgi:hypothetical protein
MKKIIIMLMVLVGISVLGAKRMPPKEVKAIKFGKVEYRQAKQIGCVEAWDLEMDSRIWVRQVYAIKYDTRLEKDIQDVFIKLLELQEDKLLVVNENDSKYEVDLETLEVKVLKGRLVECVEIEK